MKKIKILIVEDEYLIAQALKMDLEKYGFKICGIVDGGAEAIMAVPKMKPDLILMDIQLSNHIDGVSAAEAIISHQYIPIIFMTGFDKKEYLERITKINPIAFLQKPVEIANLKSVISNSFNGI
ncbi:MAG: response regulator [Candidatus Cloacimonetes bacterium]|nr:response regulator [Candidatus Cloacimonadota bacterium]